MRSLGASLPLVIFEDLAVHWGFDTVNFKVAKWPNELAIFYFGRVDRRFHILFSRYPAFLSEDELIETLLHELEHYVLTRILKRLGVKANGNGLYPEWITSKPSFSVYKAKNASLEQ